MIAYQDRGGLYSHYIAHLPVISLRRGIHNGSSLSETADFSYMSVLQSELSRDTLFPDDLFELDSEVPEENVTGRKDVSKSGKFRIRKCFCNRPRSTDDIPHAGCESGRSILRNRGSTRSLCASMVQGRWSWCRCEPFLCIQKIEPGVLQPGRKLFSAL